MKSLQKKKRVANRKLLDLVKQLPCICCGQMPGNDYNPVDPSHITTQAALGGDTLDNVVPKCRRCHTNWGQKGIAWMLNQHNSLKAWLILHGREDVIQRSKR